MDRQKWLPLRRQVDQAWIGIPTNALGWVAAMVIVFAGTRLRGEKCAIWQVIPLGMLTEILVGLAIGVITGFGLTPILWHKAGL